MHDLTEIGAAYLKLNRFDDAARVFSEILDADSQDFNALHLLGITEAKRANNEVAADLLARAINLVPTHASAYSNRAVPLIRLGRLREALEMTVKGIEIDPSNPAAHNNRGLTEHMLGQYDASLQSFRKATEIKPNFGDALWNESIYHLLHGNYDDGWRLYEERWNTSVFAKDKKKFPFPIWDGSIPVDGKTVFVTVEQGYGDNIQFSRYIPLLLERGAKVVFGVNPPLYELFKATFPEVDVITVGDDAPEFDLFAPLLSFPRAFHTSLNNIPPPTQIKFPHRYPVNIEGRRPAIGLNWTGGLYDPRAGNGLNQYTDSLRSLSLKMMQGLLDYRATWVSLQKDVRQEDESFMDTSRIADVRHAFVDFAATAAVIEKLDMIISVDSAVAHLAASMGKPTWLLIPFIPCWRWMLERKDSPWYQTVRLFRQDERRSWIPVLEEVRRELNFI